MIYRYGPGECCDPRDTEALAHAIKAIGDGIVPLEARKRSVRQAFLSPLNFEVHGRRLIKGLESLRSV